ncbi:MAG: zinc ABC transporter substrate-binding protein [Patescibacteria group bacterium]
MKKNILFWVGIIVAVGLFLYGVSHRFQQQNKPEVPSAHLQVVASFYPLAHIAEQIGKEHVNVLNLTPAGSEPHDFDPSPRDIADLQNSDVFIYNGAGFEPWANRVIAELESKGVRVIDASSSLEIMNDDPHVWLDPILVREQAQHIADLFAETDSAHAAYYAENAREFSTQLDMLHDEFVRGLAQCERRDIVTAHAAFGYLAKRYNLNMISIGGISPDAEVSPARLAEISDLVREKGITHIFFETLVSPKIAETIAQETSVQVLALNPIEGLTDEEIVQGKNYISIQRDNLQALRTALDCI